MNWAELIKEIIIICCKVAESESLIPPQRGECFQEKALWRMLEFSFFSLAVLKKGFWKLS